MPRQPTNPDAFIRCDHHGLRFRLEGNADGSVSVMVSNGELELYLLRIGRNHPRTAGRIALSVYSSVNMEGIGNGPDHTGIRVER